MSASFKTVAVAGGSGSLGRNIVHALLKKGQSKVVVLSRKAQDAEFEKLGAEIRVTDLKDVESLKKALSGVDAVVSALGGEAILIFRLKARCVPHYFFFMLTTSDGPIFGLHFVKEKLHNAIKQDNINWTIIDNGFFLGMLFSPPLGFDAQNKKAVVYGDGNFRISVTDVEDIGKYVAEALYDTRSFQQHIEVAGDTLTFNDAVKIFEKHASAKEGKPVVFEKIHVSRADLEKESQSSDMMVSVMGFVKLVVADGRTEAKESIAKSWYPHIKAKTVEDLAAQVFGK